MMRHLQKLSELVNRGLGGQPGLTLCGQAYEDRLGGGPVGTIAVKVIDTVAAPFQKQHCRESWLASRKRWFR